MEDLARHLAQLTGLTLKPHQLQALEVYAAELASWNRRFNLTAVDEPSQVQIKHFLDSFSAYLAMKNTPMRRVIDVGTGAGFPGLPLKILFPMIQLTLVESVSKKARFCEHMVDLLNLEGVRVVCERAETLGHSDEHREQYDWAVARAVARMPVLVEYLLPLVRLGGHALAMKGETAPQETQDAQQGITMLGGRLQRLIPVTLPGVVEQRYLVVVDKVAATPEKYPRRVGIPAKRPL